jgi:hypothetical protein
MLRCITGCVLWIAIIVLGPRPAGARDYLAKGWWDKPSDVTAEYERAVEKILRQGFKRNVVLRLIVLPSFDREGMIGLVRSPTGYRAFDLRASLQIWDALHERKEKFREIRPIYKEKPITSSLALRIATLWRRVLADPRNYGKEKGVVYIDSANFIFFVGFDPDQRLTANTEHFDRGTKAWELIQVSDTMYKYILGKVSESALERRIGRAEKKIEVTSSTKASNKTMQPTATR